MLISKGNSLERGLSVTNTGILAEMYLIFDKEK